MRLCQEIVLGVGGVRALRALGIRPAVWHMNEGHVAFLGARARARAGAAATAWPRRSPRSPRPRCSRPTRRCRPATRPSTCSWCAATSSRGSSDVGCELERGAGARAPSNGNFNMTALAIRLAASLNGVSRLHGEVSSDDVAPPVPGGRPTKPVGYVTNGVHTATWVGPEMRDLLRAARGPGLGSSTCSSPRYWKRIRTCPDAELWAAHRAQKERLVRFVRERVREQSRAPRPLARRAARRSRGCSTRTR